MLNMQHRNPVMGFRFRNYILLFNEVINMTNNKWNVLFYLGVLLAAAMIFGGVGFLVAAIVLLLKGDKREK